MAFQVRQTQSIRRLVSEKPTRDQVASEPSRMEVTDVGGGNCETQAETRRDRMPSSRANSHSVRTVR